MSSTWVVVADEAIARILERPEGGGDLQPVEELTDAAAHARKAKLERDAEGRRSGGGTPRGDGGRAPHALMSASNNTTSAGEDAEHLEAQGFARRVSQRLAELHQRQRFDELRIVAAPRFLGYLRKELSPALENAVTGEMDKDLVHLNPREITQRVFQANA